MSFCSRCHEKGRTLTWAHADLRKTHATATARADAAETAKLRALLVRVVKYVREDRARTPGATRLARLTEEIEGVLATLAETEGAT